MGEGTGWRRGANGREHKYVRIWKHTPYPTDNEDANLPPAPLQTHCFHLRHKRLDCQMEKVLPSLRLVQLWDLHGWLLRVLCLVRFSPWRGFYDPPSLLLILPTFSLLSSPSSSRIRDLQTSIPRPVFFPNVLFLGDCPLFQRPLTTSLTPTSLAWTSRGAQELAHRRHTITACWTELSSNRICPTTSPVRHHHQGVS